MNLVTSDVIPAAFMVIEHDGGAVLLVKRDLLPQQALRELRQSLALIEGGHVREQLGVIG